MFQIFVLTFVWLWALDPLFGSFFSLVDCVLLSHHWKTQFKCYSCLFRAPPFLQYAKLHISPGLRNCIFCPQELSMEGLWTYSVLAFALAALRFFTRLIRAVSTKKVFEDHEQEWQLCSGHRNLWRFYCYLSISSTAMKMLANAVLLWWTLQPVQPCRIPTLP